MAMRLQDVCVGVGLVLLCLYALRLALLPKPLPGIPFNKAAKKSVFGDILEASKTSPDNLASWVAAQPGRHASPICQLFFGPLQKPTIVVSDFREAQDILTRRPEFDRSQFLIDCLSGETPKFQFTLKTGPEWKAHRRLTQDLMSPDFLNKVATPYIYQSVLRLLDLWEEKSSRSQGKPFSAYQDIFHESLDAVLDFTFGNSMPERALIPQLKLMRSASEQEWEKIALTYKQEDAYGFPSAPIHPALEALLRSLDNIPKVTSSGFPKIAWWVISWFPSVKKMRATRDAMAKEQVLAAVNRLGTEGVDVEDSDEKVRSAIDLILRRERTMAQKEGRKPIYWSDDMKDEIVGFSEAGLETTSTTLCWCVKFLADNPDSQKRLRRELHNSLVAADKEERLPTREEILDTGIPYLDAFAEETLRIAHTAIATDRECLQDTVIFGHHIPKGTLVVVPNRGPSYTSPELPMDENLRSEGSRAAFKNEKEKTSNHRRGSEETMDAFWPERWLFEDTQTGKEAFDPKAWATMPFGLGRRGCFGRKLAYMQLKMTVALLVWKFEFLPCHGLMGSYEEKVVVTRKPVHCYVKLRRAN